MSAPAAAKPNCVRSAARFKGAARMSQLTLRRLSASDSAGGMLPDGQVQVPLISRCSNIEAVRTHSTEA